MAWLEMLITCITFVSLRWKFIPIDESMCELKCGHPRALNCKSKPEWNMPPKHRRDTNNMIEKKYY